MSPRPWLQDSASISCSEETMGRSPAGINPCNISDCSGDVQTNTSGSAWLIKETEKSLLWSQLCFSHSPNTPTKQSSYIWQRATECSQLPEPPPLSLGGSICVLWSGSTSSFLHPLFFWCFHSQRWLFDWHKFTQVSTVLQWDESPLNPLTFMQTNYFTNSSIHPRYMGCCHHSFSTHTQSVLLPNSSPDYNLVFLCSSTLLLSQQPRGCFPPKYPWRYHSLMDNFKNDFIAFSKDWG